jgi:hypothetical protein
MLAIESLQRSIVEAYMSEKKTQPMKNAGDNEAQRGGTQTPGPKAELPTFDDTSGTLHYSDDAAEGDGAAAGGTQPPAPQVESFRVDDTGGTVHYSDDD